MKNFEDVYAASPLQQGLLFETLSAGQTGAYFVQVVCDLKGSLDLSAFKSSWERLLARHSILRTFFVWEEMDQVLQVVSREVALPWQELNWQDLNVREQDDKLKAFIEADRAQGFNLSRAPLMRVAIIRLDESRFKFIWSHHHLVLDGWSAFQLVNEVFDLYRAFAEGRDVPFQQGPLYRDYIAWLKRQDMGEAESFWRRRLKGISQATPLLKTRASNGSSAGPQTERQRLYLTEGLTADLKSIARRHQLTLNTILQGAWALVLSRYTGDSNVLFGVVVSGRPADLPGIETMVGPFVNLLPLRVKVTSDALLLPWLKELQEHHAEIRMYEHSPMPQIQEWSGLPKGVQLFESLMAFENYPMDTSFQEHETKLRMTSMSSVEQTDFPCTFVVVPGNQLLLQLNHHANYLDGDRARQMLGCVQTVLENIAINPVRRLSELSLLTEAERQQVISEWNNTGREYPHDETISQLFEQQAERTPHSIAVSFDGVSLTYQELNERANQVAHFLQDLDLEPEALVGVLMKRGIGMVAALLGILKAGGAYVPLDPSYPSERLRFMIEDAALSVLLTQGESLDHLPSFDGQVIRLDAREIEDADRSNLPGKLGGENLAYVIYTSGSTGQPKGIAIVHRAVTRLVFNTTYIEIRPTDHVAQASNASFDAATFEIWGALLHGARLVGIGQDVMLSPSQFAVQIRQSGISVLFLTTALFNQMVSTEPDAFATVRVLLFGGEACEPRWIRESLAFRPQSLLHVYGPTESTTFATWYRVDEVGPGASTVPIGRPLSNTEIYILSRDLGPVPVGVPGEIYIGGDGLARHYLGRPELTSERFIPNPYGKAGARLYKTGDLARYLSDGNIEFIGRVDQQVKVRGFRVEPGEIEAVLRMHPDVAEAVVVVSEEPEKERRLIGYVAHGENRAPTAGELREFLSQRLPQYMIPSLLMVLKRLPLTPNGKVDREALPATETYRPDNTYEEAGNPTQQLLVEIWAQVLGVEQVGINDNFFELGGDSILSIQIAARAGRKGLQLTPRQLFEHPTIAKLVIIAESNNSVLTGSDPATGEAALTPIQTWFFEGQPTFAHHFNQAVLIRTKAEVNPEILQPVLQALLEHHDALRLRFRQRDSVWIQWYTGPEAVSFRLVKLGNLSPAEQTVAIEKEAAQTQASLNFSTGPLLRAVYFDLGSGREGRLLVVIHHLAVDGVSWRILIEDLQKGCEQMVEQGRVQMPAKTSSFKSWADSLWQQAQTDQCTKEVDYWTSQPWAGGTPPLPVDHVATETTFASLSHVRVSLGVEETRALLTEVSEACRTQINEVLLTALARAFAAWTGGSELLVDIEGHGREEEVVSGARLSRTVGWFTTIYPALIEVSAGEDIVLALQRVKKRLRAIPVRGIGYGMLRYLSRVAGVRTRMSKIPKAQVSFNYLGQFDQTVAADGLVSGAAESTGPAQNDKEKLHYLISVNGMIADRKLTISWLYSDQVYDAATIERLANAYLKALREIIAHSESIRQGAYNSSDFPLANLEQKKLDHLSALIDKMSEKSGTNSIG